MERRGSVAQVSTCAGLGTARPKPHRLKPVLLKALESDVLWGIEMFLIPRDSVLLRITASLPLLYTIPNTRCTARRRPRCWPDLRASARLPAICFCPGRALMLLPYFAKKQGIRSTRTGPFRRRYWRRLPKELQQIHQILNKK